MLEAALFVVFQSIQLHRRVLPATAYKSIDLTLMLSRDYTSPKIHYQRTCLPHLSTPTFSLDTPRNYLAPVILS